MRNAPDRRMGQGQAGHRSETATIPPRIAPATSPLRLPPPRGGKLGLIITYYQPFPGFLFMLSSADWLFKPSKHPTEWLTPTTVESPNTWDSYCISMNNAPMEDSLTRQAFRARPPRAPNQGQGRGNHCASAHPFPSSHRRYL